MFRYRVSVIIPVYNTEKYLPTAISSLVSQSMRSEQYEIILVDDGSSAECARMCDRYAQDYQNIRCLHKKNEGVSAARNAGMDIAEGEYFLFLDSDDAISSNTIRDAADFLDAHPDETDLVTYPLLSFSENNPVGFSRICRLTRMPGIRPLLKRYKRNAIHFRYRILRKSGVYDLRKMSNCFTLQTTMNICVRNSGRSGSLRFSTSLAVHEDQDYIWRVLSDKMTLGFCSSPMYLYLRRSLSTTGSSCNASRIFENTTDMWERLTADFGGRVPRYLQAMLLNDICWKSKEDILLPYHYAESDFNTACSRLRSLLRIIEPELIMSYPAADLLTKSLLLSLCTVDGVHCDARHGVVMNDENGRCIYTSDRLPIAIADISERDGNLLISGFISAASSFFGELPELYCVTDRQTERLAITSKPARCCHDRVSLPCFPSFTAVINPGERSHISFVPASGESSVRAECFFLPGANAGILDSGKVLGVGSFSIGYGNGRFEICCAKRKLS